ncbi:MAG: ABC transporter ATP-binding protein [Planctomycetes bacterium]|nr:ABC transporter ATP-binding protein [Planctomycetota bacterium]
MALLSLESVVAGYGERPVLDGVSLRVERGEVVALLGRNGAGKTTLLRVAAGLLRPRGGVARVEGHDVAALPARRAARLVAGVPQDDLVEAPFSVAEVAAMGRVAHLGPWRAEDDADRVAVRAALEAVDLAAVAGRLATELSGGERRRLSLARALAQGAPLLLLDEPTAHLDLGHEARLLATVRHLARDRGCGVLAALHDVNLAAAVADRVVLLDAGRVVADGPPATVLTAERLSAAYATPLRVLADPEGGRPVVVPGAPR